MLLYVRLHDPIFLLRFSNSMIFNRESKSQSVALANHKDAINQRIHSGRQQCTWQALRAGNVHLRRLFVSGWEVARKFASSVVHCTHTWKSVRLLSGENGSKFLPTLKPSSGQFQSYHLEKVGQLSIFTWHHNGHFSACRKKMAAMFGSQIVPRGIDVLLTLSLISPKMTAADQECKKPWVQLSNSSFLEPFGPLFLHFRLCKRQN